MYSPLEFKDILRLVFIDTANTILQYYQDAPSY